MYILQVSLQIGFLMALSVLGMWIKEWFSLPIPGSIIGFILLLLLLSFRVVPERFVSKGSAVLLFLLPVLLIPFNLGIMEYPELLSMAGAVMIFSVIVSTLVSMIIIGHICQSIEKKATRVGGVESD
ncbi:CidA/LrgA family protein [Alkalihalobacillus sp. 1P02AB]|uniref:CidA/LrgA family protein n=1 Tax=Alkalihalobacillus sp. 1P02AB TaxID=3132260 RepID=UPI0039A52203